MFDLRFFDFLCAEYSAHPQLQSITTRFQTLPKGLGRQFSQQVYRELLECLLVALNIPHNLNSGYQELSPLFQLPQVLSSGYFTQALIQRELAKCPTLEEDQQEELSRSLEKFYQFLRHTRDLTSLDLVYDRAALLIWLSIMPPAYRWEGLQVLVRCGIPLPASREGFRAWNRYVSGFEDTLDTSPLEWIDACGRWAEANNTPPALPDLWAQAFANQLLHFKLNGPCADLPQCHHCPLAKQCRLEMQNAELAAEPGQDDPLHNRGKAIGTLELLSDLFELNSEQRRFLKSRLRDSGIFKELENLSDEELAQLVPHRPQLANKFRLLFELCRRYTEARPQPGVLLRTPAMVFEQYHLRCRPFKQEVFFVLLLDSRLRLLHEAMVAVGTLNKAIVHPREVFSPAIEYRASKVILVHNHPSGDPHPSEDDIALTNRLVEAGKLVDIKVHDHVIIGDNRYFSLANQGYL